MGSYTLLQKDIEDNIKPKIEEILILLKNQNADNVKEIIEAAAAKIISELTILNQKCHCNKEIIEAFNKRPSLDLELVPVNQDLEPRTSRLSKYSYPNDRVGNEKLGTGKNPGSLTWPFGSDSKKSS